MKPVDAETLRELLKKVRREEYGPTRGSKCYDYLADFDESGQNSTMVALEGSGHRDVKSLESGLKQTAKRMGLEDKLLMSRRVPAENGREVFLARREWVEAQAEASPTQADLDALWPTDEKRRDLFRERLVGTSPEAATRSRFATTASSG
jgi:hypothetical protein